MSQNLTDRQLDDIVLQYKDMVYRIAVLRMKNRNDADDVFQEVFIRLVRHVDGLESQAHIKAWLIRVTINCCNSFYADTFRKRTVSYDDELEKPVEYDGAENVTVAESLYGEDSYAVEGDGDSVLAAVKRLSPAYRDVIYLFYYEDMPIRRIAETLGIREGAVKTRLSRARDILKDRLKDVVTQ